MSIVILDNFEVKGPKRISQGTLKPISDLALIIVHSQGVNWSVLTWAKIP